jgi:hypothetical protein
MVVFSPGRDTSNQHVRFRNAEFVIEGKEVIHTVLYVVYSMLSDVLSKKFLNNMRRNL